jgi:hypothetical protein
MAQQQETTLPPELEEPYARAVELGSSPELFRAFQEALADPSTWDVAARDPAAFVGDRGIELPPGLEIQFLDDPIRERPVPDFEFFTIRLTQCRKYWVKKKNAPGYEEVTFCRGWEIVPNPVPGGPIG